MMKTQLLALSAGLVLAACDTRVVPAGGGDTTVVNPPATENNTTIVNPPAEKKVENNTTVVNPPPADVPKTEVENKTSTTTTTTTPP